MDTEDIRRRSALVMINSELSRQNEELIKELVIANRKLELQSRDNIKKSESALSLIKLNEELSQQNEELEKRATLLNNANKELELFAYVSSHDLQEPLRKIQSFTGMILNKEENLSDSSRDYFMRIQKSSSRMQQLISDLLVFSRVTNGERNIESVNLNEVMKEIEVECKEEIENKNATINYSKLCSIDGIKFQIHQMLSNLISNSLKFSDSSRDPIISISSQTVNGSDFNEGHFGKKYCHISFRDNGIGFDPQYKDRIFQIFQKLHSKDEYKGTGIGLAIVKKIIDNHNGFIIADSELDKGANFDIYIPINIK